MSKAQILWNGNAGPYDLLVAGTPALVENNNDGDEALWDFVLTKKPATSSAVLTSVVGQPSKRSLTPDVKGGYVVRLVVDNTHTDVSEGSALYPDGLRMPAVGETVEHSALEGWARSLKDVFDKVSFGGETRPAASAALRGHIWHDRKGVGVQDTFDACLKNALDTYQWYNLLGSGGSSVVRRTPVLKSFADHGSTLTAGELDHTFIVVDTTGGPTTLNIPTLTPAEEGSETTIKVIGSNPLTLVAAGAASLDGGPAIVMNTIFQARNLTFLSAFPMWWVS